MGTGQLQNSRGFIAISLIAVLFVLTAACGGEVADTTASGDVAAPSADVEKPPSSPTVEATASQIPEPTEPLLINTPVPVVSTAPDFTLPSIQGADYTLSQFRDDRPVAVVFYRAYW